MADFHHLAAALFRGGRNGGGGLHPRSRRLRRLIRLNNGRTNTQGYYAKVYGEDDTVPSASKAADGLALPVFGINRTMGGLLAIIEDGEAFATLTRPISAGNVNSYNTAYASFEVLTSSSLELGDVLGAADKVLTFGSHIYQGNFQMAGTASSPGTRPM